LHGVETLDLHAATAGAVVDRDEPLEDPSEATEPTMTEVES
jgi:hypothetical protein